MLIFIQYVLLNGTLTKSSQSITSFLNTTLPHYKIRNDNKEGQLLAITPWISLSYKAPKHKFNIRTICRNWVKFHACIKFWRFYLQLAVDIKNYKVLVTVLTCTCIGEMKFSNKPDFNCSFHNGIHRKASTLPWSFMTRGQKQILTWFFVTDLIALKGSQRHTIIPLGL